MTNFIVHPILKSQKRREPLSINDDDSFPLDAFSIPPQYKVRRTPWASIA